MTQAFSQNLAAVLSFASVYSVLFVHLLLDRPEAASLYQRFQQEALLRVSLEMLNDFP
ncbi:hypothetical protein D3C86_2189710 [compost metagenome]